MTARAARCAKLLGFGFPGEPSRNDTLRGEPPEEIAAAGVSDRAEPPTIEVSGGGRAPSPEPISARAPTCSAAACATST
ncbi:hypothetical protein [Amycolatopsis sp. H20-H5]|uniref:hypothetical protein n=1 Tax=Amycolatopsis sp. H20-H5 TaxID=3046309 RepID=UPI003FA3497D